MQHSTVSIKEQMALPAVIRKQFGLDTGCTVFFSVQVLTNQRVKIILPL